MKKLILAILIIATMIAVVGCPQNYSAPYGPTGRTATLVVASANATPLEKSQADFVCDGTADDVQIQAAIDALPETGGTIRLEGPLFNLDTGLTIGDGSNVSISSRSAVKLIGDGGAYLLGLTSSVLKYTGSPTLDRFIYIKGPIVDVTISGFFLNCNYKVNTGIEIVLGALGHLEDITVDYYLVWGIDMSTWNVLPAGASFNCGGNYFKQVSAYPSPYATTAGGLRMGTQTTIGCSRNIFIDCDFWRGGAASSHSIELGNADNNYFLGGMTSGYNGTVGYGIYFNGNGNWWPSENAFYNYAATGSIGGVSGTSGNWFIPLPTGDGEQIPTIPYVYGMTYDGKFFGGTLSLAKAYLSTTQSAIAAPYTIRVELDATDFDLGSCFTFADWYGASGAYRQADNDSGSNYIQDDDAAFPASLNGSLVKWATNAAGTTNTGVGYAVSISSDQIYVAKTSGTDIGTACYYWIKKAQYIAPVSGYYQVSINVRHGTTEVDKSYQALLLINGDNGVTFPKGVETSSANVSISAVSSGVVHLNAGDVVQLGALSSGSNAVSGITGGINQTVLNIYCIKQD
jgi:hypothetical protein